MVISRVCSGTTSLEPTLLCPPDSLNVNLPLGTCGELTASPNPSDLLGTNKVGVEGTMPITIHDIIQ